MVNIFPSTTDKGIIYLLGRQKTIGEIKDDDDEGDIAENVTLMVGSITVK